MVRVLAAAAVLVLLMLAGSACGDETPRPAATVTATANTEAAHEDLLDLAGTLVGGRQFLADPSSGRLPDVGAIHRAGIASLTVSNGRIRVVFLDTASDSQRRLVVETLRTSPLVLSVAEGAVSR